MAGSCIDETGKNSSRIKVGLRPLFWTIVSKEIVTLYE